jgi:hypothetical protein
MDKKDYWVIIRKNFYFQLFYKIDQASKKQKNFKKNWESKSELYRMVKNQNINILKNKLILRSQTNIINEL